jgi:hypothetical protein
MDYSLVVTEIGKILLGVVIGTFFTGWYKDFKSKKDDRKRLFLRLVAAKGYATVPQWLIDDINMIEIVFRGRKKVIEKYRIYYADLCIPFEKTNIEKQAADYWDLLRVMGNCVGYKDLDNKTLHTGYLPTGALNEYTYTMEYRKLVLPFLHQMTELSKVAIPLNELLTEYHEGLAEAAAEKAANEKKPDEAKDEQST